MANKASKGSAFERAFCKRLSLWWTDDARDDVFWRSTTSGARATTRAKAGKQTAGQYGDVAATDPIGAPLLDLMCIELKRGYNKHTIHDCLDRSPTAAMQVYNRFFAQAETSCNEAGAYSWLLVCKRDRREPLVFYPRYLHVNLRTCGLPVAALMPAATIICDLGAVMVLPLDLFLMQVTPAIVKKLIVKV